MLLYAITDRRQLAGGEAERRAGLVTLARQWARGGVDYLQIREKDLPREELLTLTRQIVGAVKNEAKKTKVLLNGEVSIALEAGADGVHLPGGAASNAALVKNKIGREAIVSQSCHSSNEAAAAREATLILFAPVFEKVTAEAGLPGQGLKALEDTCRAAAPTPVFALGGVTLHNAQACITAGAQGVAAIRLFLNGGWRQLRLISG